MTPVMLRTPRLNIRDWHRADAPRMLDIQSRVEVMKWLGDGPPSLAQDLDDARRRIDRYVGRGTVPPLGAWAIEVAATGLVAGTVLLIELPNAEHGEVEIGWHLHPDCWGQGYATEAATAVRDHGFAHGLPEILAVTDPDNHPSQAVCRRLGMRDEGIVEQWYAEPSRLFRITAAEWRAGK